MENEKENKPMLIVDGDILNFTIGRATEDISDFGDQVCKSFNEESVIEMLEAGLDKISNECGYPREDIIYAISCENNYRKKFFPTYKSNRKNVVKPLGLSFLRQYLKDNKDKYNLLLITDLEADDAIGIYGTLEPDKVSIYSQDKDLRTVPVRQWDFKKNKFWTPTDLQAIKWLYTQVLTGDSVDGYIGCPKIGKIKAKAALEECNNELELIEQTFVRYFIAYNKDIDMSKSKMLEQLGQARILQHLDYLELMNFERTYDPFRIMNIKDDQLKEWSDNYMETLIIKKKKVKDVQVP